MDFAYDDTTVELQQRLLAFMDECVYPAEPRFREEAHSLDDRWGTLPVIEELKAEARRRAVVEPVPPADARIRRRADEPRSTRRWRRSPGETHGSRPRRSTARRRTPGNMELLSLFGTDEQKERWLEPLLEGEIRSAFSMTEPEVASSDATNIATRIERDGDDYVINGRKWWTSGAMSPRCKLLIVMGVTDPEATRHRRQSMILVPKDTPGVNDAAVHEPVRLRRRTARRPRRDRLRQRPGPGVEPPRRRGRRVPDRPGAPRARPDPPRDACDRDGRARARDDVRADGAAVDVRASDHRARGRPALDLRVAACASSRCACWC